MAAQGALVSTYMFSAQQFIRSVLPLLTRESIADLVMRFVIVVGPAAGNGDSGGEWGHNNAGGMNIHIMFNRFCPS